jgi:3-keto-disaccharide hydrolase
MPATLTPRVSLLCLLTWATLPLAGCAAKPLAFQFSDPDGWRFESSSGELVLHTMCRYKPAVRSPRCIALIDGREFGDFVLEVEAMQTGKDVPHRDLCFFFGVRNASNYYYVHIAKAADRNAHNIFRVADKPRTNIAEATTAGVDWGAGEWHRVKIERDLDSGSIRVYFDDMESPIMRATDTTHGWGMIGVGSFDDSGRFRNITVRGPGSRPTTRRVFDK